MHGRIIIVCTYTRAYVCVGIYIYIRMLCVLYVCVCVIFVVYGCGYECMWVFVCMCVCLCVCFAYHTCASLQNPYFEVVNKDIGPVDATGATQSHFNVVQRGGHFSIEPSRSITAVISLSATLAVPKGVIPCD